MLSSAEHEIFYNLEAKFAGYKKNFISISDKHEILSAHRYNNIKKFSIFPA